MSSISDVVDPDAPRTINEKGGSQSHVPVRFDLIDGPALFSMAAVLHEGAVKYGDNNWRLISVEDHINHLIMHAYAFLSGDKTDEHLSHIMCRSMFAQGVHLASAEILEDLNLPINVSFDMNYLTVHYKDTIKNVTYYPFKEDSTTMKEFLFIPKTNMYYDIPYSIKDIVHKLASK